MVVGLAIVAKPPPRLPKIDGFLVIKMHRFTRFSLGKIDFHSDSDSPHNPQRTDSQRIINPHSTAHSSPQPQRSQCTSTGSQAQHSTGAQQRTGAPIQAHRRSTAHRRSDKKSLTMPGCRF
jgi:hypothetical protein